MADLGRGDFHPHDGDRHPPDPIRGRLHVLRDDHLTELVEDLLEDVLEGLEMRLAFEAWADSR